MHTVEDITRGTARRWNRRPGFTLMELLIVIAILGILGAMVVPRISDAYSTTAQNTLKDQLRYMRTQLAVYKAQHHEVPPGYPPGDPKGVPTADYVAQQMTKNTDESGKTGTDLKVYRCGPYINRMPMNPVNRLDTVLVVPDGTPIPVPNNATGWIYKPQTVEIIANTTGSDSNGTPYVQY